MISAFDKLSDSDIELVLRAPIIACILIAGADGDVDRKEIQKAITLTQRSATKSKSALIDYFKLVQEDFEDKLKVVLQTLPHSVEERNKLIVDELTRLNSVFHKLQKTFVTEFLIKMRELTHSVAASSGGVLGMNKVGDEEAQYVDLPMLKNPA